MEQLFILTMIIVVTLLAMDTGASLFLLFVDRGAVPVQDVKFQIYLLIMLSCAIVWRMLRGVHLDNIGVSLDESYAEPNTPYRICAIVEVHSDPGRPQLFLQDGQGIPKPYRLRLGVLPVKAGDFVQKNRQGRWTKVEGMTALPQTRVRVGSG